MPNLEDYTYTLPPGLIAHEPASPRDSSRLFVYDTQDDRIYFDTFRNITTYLKPKTTLVFNDTKVLPARLFLKKETGGKVQILLSMNEVRGDNCTVRGIADKKIEIGKKLFFASGDYLLVVAQEEQFFIFEPSIAIKDLPVLLLKEGHTPIPPYIKHNHMDERELRKKYQSILAKAGTSVAAPTASLHFTNRVLKRLEKKHINQTTVTLHVGAGTFAPINDDNLRTKKLFSEYCAISKRAATTINRALGHEHNIIPVGSTAMRTLESFAVAQTGPTGSHRSVLCSGEKATTIFIYPPYQFQIATGLITNFHVPRSSLMLMVDAFLTHKHAKRNIMNLYEIAMQEKFRFYSFGDAMLVL